jgi:hypothetical protein
MTAVADRTRTMIKIGRVETITFRGIFRAYINTPTRIARYPGFQGKPAVWNIGNKVKSTTIRGISHNSNIEAKPEMVRTEFIGADTSRVLTQSPYP